MLQNLVRFTMFFIIIVLGGYLAHKALIINHFVVGRNIEIVNLSYKFNAAFTFVFTLTIILLSKKYKDQIGFIFLVGSFVKTGIFLALIKMNNIEINKSAFLDFFIPYLVCLSLEIYYIAKLLNNHK